MHHIPLDRARPHNRHLDHQVVKTPRLQPRQHAHLSPTLDLEHAHRVGPTDHLVHRRILGRHLRHRVADRPPAHLGRLALLATNHRQAAVDGRQHPQRQAIHLQDPQRVQIVLVPLDHRSTRHRRVFDRDQLRQQPSRDHHPANVLRQMAGKSEYFTDQGHQLATEP